MNYAIIEDGQVANMAVADIPLAANWVATEEAGIGWTYTDGVFAAPVVPVPTRSEVINARLAEIDKLCDKPRTVRELALGNVSTIAYVTKLDAEAAALRLELRSL